MAEIHDDGRGSHPASCALRHRAHGFHPPLMPGQPMHTLITITYADAHHAPDVLPALHRLRDQHLVDIAAAVAVVIDQNGIPRLQAATDVAGSMADHAFWDGLLHALFIAPLSDAANGAEAPARAVRPGVAPEFARAFRAAVHPGGSVALILVPHAIPAWGIPLTSRFGGTVMATPLRSDPGGTPPRPPES